MALRELEENRRDYAIIRDRCHCVRLGQGRDEETRMESRKFGYSTELLVGDYDMRRKNGSEFPIARSILHIPPFFFAF